MTRWLLLKCPSKLDIKDPPCFKWNTEGICGSLEMKSVVTREPHSSIPLSISVFWAHLIDMQWVCIYPYSPSGSNNNSGLRSGWVGWDACKVSGRGPLIMIERVMGIARLCGYKTTSGMCTVASRGWLCVWGRERRRRCWDFHLPHTSTFITNPSRVKWMLRHSKLTPENDRSGLSCLPYHFPSKWYGWGSDNCHPDLASLHHSPKTL